MKGRAWQVTMAFQDYNEVSGKSYGVHIPEDFCLFLHKTGRADGSHLLNQFACCWSHIRLVWCPPESVVEPVISLECLVNGFDFKARCPATKPPHKNCVVTFQIWVSISSVVKPGSWDPVNRYCFQLLRWPNTVLGKVAQQMKLSYLFIIIIAIVIIWVRYWIGY